MSSMGGGAGGGRAGSATSGKPTSNVDRAAMSSAQMQQQQQHLRAPTFQIPPNAYARPLSLPTNNSNIDPPYALSSSRSPIQNQPLSYTPPESDMTPYSSSSTGTDAGGFGYGYVSTTGGQNLGGPGAAVHENEFDEEDPMWAEEMFDADVEVMGEEEMGGGRMVSSGAGAGNKGVQTQWRGGLPSSPGASPSHSTLPLPLASDSPALPSRGDDFDSNLKTAGGSSDPGSHDATQGLHDLIPTLGVSQAGHPVRSPRSTSSIQSMPRPIPQGGAGGAGAVGSFSYGQTGTSTYGQQVPIQHIHSPTSSSSLSGSLPKSGSTSATHQPPHYNLSGLVPAGSSPPDLRRQAGISAALASSNRAAGNGPTLSLSPGGTVQRPSPLGQHYLAQTDPQHISKQPMGSIQFGATPYHQPLFPTMAPLRNPAEASPTLSIEPEEKLADYDAFGDAHGQHRHRQNLFPSMSMVTGKQQEGQASGGISNSNDVQPHQVPLPPSPAMGYYSTASPPVRRISQDFGSPAVRAARTFEEPSMAPTRPRMRQNTDASFASTSSEEEDISSPMILGDVQMGRKAGGGSPSIGVSPRANPATGFSPRSNTAGTMNAESSSSSMFPDLRKVQDLAKMRSPLPAGGSGLPFGRTSFSFLPGKSAPVFPPMSASSSSSDGFDDSDEDDDAMVAGGDRSDAQRSARRYAPMGRARHVGGGGQASGEEEDAENGGSNGNGEGGHRDSSDRPEMPRSASITIGGSGYSDEHFRDEHRGDSDSDGEPPKPPGRDNRGRLEAAPMRKVKKKKSRSRSQSVEEVATSEIATGADLADEADSEHAPVSISHADDDEEADEADDDEEDGDDGEDFKGKKRKSTGKAPAAGDSKAKRRKSTVQEQGNVTCDYIDPLPPHNKCDSRFHRVYDEQRHQATIHARDEGRAVRAGKLEEKDAKLWVQYGRPQVEWICSCGQIFSRRDALMRHARKH